MFFPRRHFLWLSMFQLRPAFTFRRSSLACPVMTGPSVVSLFVRPVLIFPPPRPTLFVGNRSRPWWSLNRRVHCGPPFLVSPYDPHCLHAAIRLLERLGFCLDRRVAMKRRAVCFACGLRADPLEVPDSFFFSL